MSLPLHYPLAPILPLRISINVTVPNPFIAFCWMCSNNHNRNVCHDSKWLFLEIGQTQCVGGIHSVFREYHSNSCFRLQAHIQRFNFNVLKIIFSEGKVRIIFENTNPCFLMITDKYLIRSSQVEVKLFWNHQPIKWINGKLSGQVPTKTIVQRIDTLCNANSCDEQPWCFSWENLSILPMTNVNRAQSIYQVVLIFTMIVGINKGYLLSWFSVLR